MDEEERERLTESVLPEMDHATVRAFKRASSRLRDVLEGPAEGLAINYEMSASRDGPTTSSLKLGDRIHRHAALLRPFLAAGSPIELSTVWARLKSDPSVDDTIRRRVDAAFLRADRLSMALNVDGRDLTARDIYFAYGEGRYFSDDPRATELMRALDVGPMSGLVEMLFHDVCGGYTRLVSFVLDPLLRWEREHPAPETGDWSSTCIYCLGTDGDFAPEEHVIPESLVGDKAVIADSVCATCNNRLSLLDEVLQTFEPVAMLRTVYGPLTKKGKFPKARFRDIDIERTAPRAIKVTAKGGRRDKPPELQPDGTYRFSISATGRKRFEPQPLARALFKMALGLLALHQGREVAVENRYNQAREFIRLGTPVETHLVIVRSAKPHPAIRTAVDPDSPGTPVLLDIFGFVATFSLEAAPLGAVPEELSERLQTLWLGAGEDPSGDPLHVTSSYLVKPPKTRPDERAG